MKLVKGQREKVPGTWSAACANRRTRKFASPLLNMNRQELINTIAAQTESSKIATARFVDSFTATVQETVLLGEKVKLAGFGTFERFVASARVGRNPKTGQEYRIEAATLPRFIPSELFKDRTRSRRSQEQDL